jgi:hypothetical protein
MGQTPRCPDCGSPLAGESWSEEIGPFPGWKDVPTW